MLTKRLAKFVLVGLAAALAMPAPARACGFLDCLFGRSRNSVAQTTYAPAYYGSTAASYAPANYAPASYAPTYSGMNCCASPITTCAPQTCYYAPETHYRVLNRPILTALFGPQLAPVTTYRMTCSSVAPSVAYAPMGSYVSGASYSAPTVSSGCCGASLSPTQSYIAPGPAPYVAPEAAPQSVVPRTFGPADVQPSLLPERQESLKPVPDGNTRLESTPGPRLIDPDNRTTAAPVRYAVYQMEAAAPAAPNVVKVQWQPATR
ncbi:MAG: hypothetical protein U1E05_00115 [Patescibacteria group bacterium]|nr:hypothetical protein [Patescibacteria group bacterium]